MTEPRTPSELTRGDRNLDIERLRAFAVLFVIIAHIAWIQGELNERLWFHLQPWTGVDLFFVISGFVVSGAFERDIVRFAGTPYDRLRAVLAFYTKRFARILPTAYTGLLLCWLGWMFFNQSGAWGAAWSGDEVTGMVLSHALFFSNYAMVFGAVDSQLGWYWSLCVEEHFYLIYPAFRLFTRSTGQRARALGIVVLGTVFVARMLSDSPRALQQFSHNRFDQLALGVLLHLSWQRWTPAFRWLRGRLEDHGAARRLCTLVMAFLLFAICALPTVMRVAGPPEATQLFLMRVGLVVTGVLSLILVALASFDLDLLSFGSAAIGRLLVGVGARSYALYMYHLPAKWITQELYLRHPGLLAGGRPNGRAILLYLTVLAVIVELNHRLIERPFIRFGRKAANRIADETPADVAPGGSLPARTAVRPIAPHALRGRFGVLIAALVMGVLVFGIALRRGFREASRSGQIASVRSLPPQFEDFVRRAGPALGVDARVYLRPDVGPDLEDSFGPVLFYRGMPRAQGDDALWATLEQGTAENIAAALAQMKVTHVLIQTAQPRPRVFERCVHGPALLRSEPIPIDAHSSYALEVYRIDSCQTPAAEPSR